MEVVELKVQVEKSQLAALEKDIKALQSKRIKISVDASGFNALSKSTQSAMRNVTQYVNAVTRAQEQETKLQVARERTATATQKRMQAESNLARQVERTKTAQADATVQAQKTAQAQARVAQQTEKTRTAQAQYATQVEKTATAQAKAVNQTEKVSKSTSLLGDSLGNVALKMAAWQVMGDLVATPIRALKEALDTMKAVDDQLVDVRKVTGFTEAQMKALEEQSYATASAYGEAADEYLASVAEFARAGYGEQAEALAELSTKTKIVGDTTSEVANQFLLSVDAAYQYQGSVEKLSAVLDGVNEIDNKYATSISNIAEGLGKVAPIASQAGVGVDELSAAIGTITAVTQRSGTEAATAFRALMLNIMGDTKTEIDEGVTWTTGEIAGLRDVLKIYASDVVEAADATGSLINPMEAIGALAQSMEDGVLTEQKLMEMVSDIGGKLRTSQLLALIQNWDMYESMLADFSNAAGSADKEVENAMDSWSRKAEVLKNTWTQFVQGFINTDVIKGAFDGVTQVISSLNTDAGKLGLEFVALSAALTGVAKAGIAVKNSELAGTITSIFSTIGGMGGKSNFKAGISLLGEVFSKSPTAWAAAAAAAIIGVTELVDALTVSFEEQQEIVDELQNKYDSLTGEDSELASLRELKASGEELTEIESRRLAILEGQAAALEKQLQTERQKELRAFTQEEGMVASENDDGQRVYITRYEDVKNTVAELNSELQQGKISSEEFGNALGEVVSENKDFYDQLIEYRDAGVQLYDWQWKFIDQYEDLSTQYSRVEEGLAGLTEVETAAMGAFKVFDVDQAAEALMRYGATAEQAQAAIDKMASEDHTIALDLEGDPEELVKQLQETGYAAQQLNENGKIEIDVSALSGKLSELGKTREEIAGILNGIQELDYVEMINIPVDVQTAMDEVVTLRANAQGELEVLGSETAEPSVNLDTTEFDAGIAKVDTELSKPRSGSATYTINVQPRISGIGGIFAGLFGSNAEGTDNYSGGTTLLGDEYSPDGSPRPELVITKDQAVLVGRDGPEFRNLPSGARVLPYKETKKVLERSEKPVQEEVYPAFSGGTDGDAHLEELEGNLSLLESQYDFLEASGANPQELISKNREVQAALHEINEYLRSIGGEEEEILDNSTEWWKKLEDIHDTQKEIYEDDRDLLESQLELMENQGRSAEERIRKLEEIQDNLHEEAEYLRSIGASQEEINELSNEWWDIQNDIKDIQEDLWDELEEAVDKELERAREARDLELAALDKAKEKLDEERQAKEEELTLEEKILAVQEAQAALANAQNERTIRTYNAATGQWEWVADASTVKSAEEALEDAEKDLADYKADLEYQAAVDAIEARREAIESAYEALEESWEDIIDSVQEPTREISDILNDIAKNGTPLMKQQIDNVGKLLGDLNNYIVGAIGDTTGESYYGGGGLPSMDFSNDTTDYSALMDRAQTVEEFNHWASLRKEKMEAQGINPGDEGWRSNAEIFEEWKDSHPGWEAGVGSSAGILGGGSSSGGSGGGSSSSGGGGGKVVGSINGKAPAGLSVGDKVVTQGGTYQITGVNSDGSYNSNKVSNQTKNDYESSGGKYDTYDSGGVLRGLGGIKATAEDEMILPPDITAAMLSPAADATFQARLAELGVLYGAKAGPLTMPAGVSQNRDSHDHHGDNYTFGDVTLTEEQARGMTVYDLAQKSRSLGIYGWQH